MRNRIKSPNKKELIIIKVMVVFGVFSVLNFLIYFFQPEHRGNEWLFWMLAVTLTYGSLRKLYMWYNYLNISVPEQKLNNSNLKVDILTTYFPGEPYQMTVTTLEAINQISYPHTTYLCDEADDPYLKKFCKENGIIHVTRDNRKDAKAGNINNALKKHATGDICVILDPDHIPQPDFLDPILPHFEDPEIGFVQIVQSYYNVKETLVARGAAEQTFQFYGPMMMTLNSYGSVNAIGANCVFRRKALDSIGGHAPGLCEDMHTAMLLYAKGWKAVYLPEVLAKGLAPSNLTNFFKQQLKWSRGTFDLLVKVYPKIFNKLTIRQRIHFGMLPLHYLSGVICLLNFIIPVLSLLLFTTPWHGNIVEFVLVILPVIGSSVLIRTFIQKWVIEKKERGFHIVGGLLHINTWWIHLIGLFYTIINKKVPYLPTPKEDEFDTNLKIIIPNAIIAALSLFAIIVGLRNDLTPFSLIMAGFALFNAGIMIFGIYMAVRETNQNQILRTNLAYNTILKLKNIKIYGYKLANKLFFITRKGALPLLLVVLFFSIGFKINKDLSKWNEIEADYPSMKSDKYLGIFYPTKENGLSDMSEINYLEAKENIDFDIISLYIAWNQESISKFPDTLLNSIYRNDAIPLVTWEPWATGINKMQGFPKIEDGQNVFRHIADGHLDSYIKCFIEKLKSFDEPVFLRYAHEFDNPQYPWSQHDRSQKDYIEAWKQIHKLIQEEQADKIIMIWSPWKAENMRKFYPGDDYVDWIGLTLLNYSKFNENGNYYSFEELYEPFHDEFYWFTRKPVMLAEFGSLDLANKQQKWINEALNSIESYKEIQSLVLFNSKIDKNIPENYWYREPYLDWEADLSIIAKKYPTLRKRKPFELTPTEKDHILNPITLHNIRGVNLSKGKDWDDSYYTLTRKNLINDFSVMKENGINTIQFTGGNIYDYNILNLSGEMGLNSIYGFNIDTSVDFLRNKGYLDTFEKKIFSKVNKLKNNLDVIGYSFRFDLENHFTKPLLFAEEIAYLNWITTIIKKIKSADPSKSIVLQMNLEANTRKKILELQKDKKLPVDSYGLIVKDTIHLKKTLQLNEEGDISVFISDIDPHLVINHKAVFEDQDLILHTFQDERESNKMSFDGLVDFKGRKKKVLNEIGSFWSKEKSYGSDFSVKIIRPALPLYPGDRVSYSAAISLNGEWQIPSNEGFEFDWHLVKNDQFGNHLAIKEVGKGAKIELQVPSNYKNYELIVTASNKEGEYVVTSSSPLHIKMQD